MPPVDAWKDIPLASSLNPTCPYRCPDRYPLPTLLSEVPDAPISIPYLISQCQMLLNVFPTLLG